MFRGLWLPSTQTPAGRLRKLPPVFRRLESTIAEKSHVPRFAQPSIWKDIIPKPLRSWPGSSKPAQNTRNPAYYFIWIYLLIGSQAIRILTIKREAAEEHRLADIKLRQLREVIEKLERGEEVDVEKALGTGNEEAEAEWEAALRELESEERLWQNNRSRRRAERHKRQMEEMDADPINEEDSEELHDPRPLDRPQSAPTTPGFY
ncbi:uncharacterized protein HMPREF1541_07950 [Cyphellophora europaea CBS 101466]|uniref:Uncharacterized protein n=1 Tax=Cyphellophora europaea (strain CBS 101466) TaxID=1220924 RepID=W2RKF6_CYPE1|nr:uncharacterized protein HMPREF1541_07950 [Cyphellophora europaea CBS 101466]ETN36962.1 hypothetical protein HMPREF1541_07950 [Cyphellophora europaea CBS 101466]